MDRSKRRTNITHQIFAHIEDDATAEKLRSLMRNDPLVRHAIDLGSEAGLSGVEILAVALVHTCAEKDGLRAILTDKIQKENPIHVIKDA